MGSGSYFTYINKGKSSFTYYIYSNVQSYQDVKSVGNLTKMVASRA